MYLTERQKEIINLVKVGYASKQIAEKLCITESTVKGTLTKIMEHCGAKNRTHCVYLCMKSGIID